MSAPQPSKVDKYSFMFNQNVVTGMSIGSNASVGNATFNLLKNDDKNPNSTISNNIMFTTNSRKIDQLYYQNVFCGLFLNNNTDLIALNYCQVSSIVGLNEPNNNIVVNATYISGDRYKGKNITVTISNKTSPNTGNNNFPVDVSISYN